MPTQPKKSGSKAKKRNGAPRPKEMTLTPKKYAKHVKHGGSVVEGLGSGGSKLILNLLSPEVEAGAFAAILEEVGWGEMRSFGKPVPRLVAIQAALRPGGAPAVKGAVPLYRHPADEQPPVVAWTPFVGAIIRQLTEHLGQPFNHALVQLYRSGADSISQHSDKTLDIAPGTPIVNVSFGASRLFTLRSKAKLKAGTGAVEVQRLTLPHNSAFVLDMPTNASFTHQISPDKRLPGQRRPDETAYDGQRISITARCVATYLRESDGRVFGQGAQYKTEAELDAALGAGHTHAGKLPTPAATVAAALKTPPPQAKLDGDGEEAADLETPLVATGPAKPEETPPGPTPPTGAGAGMAAAAATVPDGSSTMVAATAAGTGTGAPTVEADGARSSGEAEVDRMLAAFRTENKLAREFDYSAVYGGGFDVVGHKLIPLTPAPQIDLEPRADW